MSLEELNWSKYYCPICTNKTLKHDGDKYYCLTCGASFKLLDLTFNMEE